MKIDIKHTCVILIKKYRERNIIANEARIFGTGFSSKHPCYEPKIYKYIDKRRIYDNYMLCTPKCFKECIQ